MIEKSFWFTDLQIETSSLETERLYKITQRSLNEETTSTLTSFTNTLMVKDTLICYKHSKGFFPVNIDHD